MTEGKEYTPPDITRALPIDEIPVDRLENPRIVSAPNGKLAFGTDEGVGYKEVNEDALVVNTRENRYAVIDGLGGEGGGDRASRCAAEEFQKAFREGLSGDDAHTRVYDRLVSEGMRKEGLCYLNFTINNRELEGFMAGDVRLIILLSDGRVFFETTDEGDGNAVDNAISGVDRGDATPFESDLYRGMRIIVATDGLWKNFSSEEVADLAHGKSIDQAIADLNREVKQKMQTKGGSPDNISVVIYDMEKAADGSALPEVNTKALMNLAGSIDDLMSLVREEKRIAGMTGAQLYAILEDVRDGKKGIPSVPEKDGVQNIVRNILLKPKPFKKA